MTAHPNRSRRTPSPGRNPAPAEIAQAREEAELTQAQAGALIYAPMRTWQDWERGVARMSPAAWEYFCLLISSQAVRNVRDEWLITGGF